MLTHIMTFILAFVGIWIGSGLVIRAVEKLSHRLRMSSFAISFLVLGVFTSIGELSVGINAVLDNDPEIMVGNLIGASIVLFLLVIPLLAIVGRSIRVSPEFQGFNLPASLVVIALPVILAMDGILGRTDSVIALIMFGVLLISIETKKGLKSKLILSSPTELRIGKELLKIVFGIVTIFMASWLVVEQTMYMSKLLNVPPFVISLLFVAIGTNIPELSLVVRSAFVRNHQVAFGDFVGSAAVNTFLVGLLTLIYGKPISLTNNYLVSLLFLLVGLVTFYFFARSKNTISRIEGLMMLGIYIVFIGVEWYFRV